MPMIAVNGIELSGEQRGEGEAVVYVCGTGQPAAMWDMVGRADVDAAGFRTIAYDNRGVRPSEVPEPPYAMQDLIDDAIAVIEHFDAAACHLVGASLGANIVFSVAHQRPDLVASAVLLVGGGNFRPQTAEEMANSLDAYRQGGEAAQNVQRKGLFDAMLTTAQRHDAAAQAAVEPIIEMFGNSSDDWTGAIGQVTANMDWAGRDHLDDAAEISVPTLMIANEGDAYFAPEDLRAAADRMTDCTFVLKPGLPHVSLDPDELNENSRLVIEFLNAHRSG
jgi:pimeloyl-ACP methyl ester carboxylesterase